MAWVQHSLLEAPRQVSRKTTKLPECWGTDSVDARALRLGRRVFDIRPQSRDVDFLSLVLLPARCINCQAQSKQIIRAGFAFVNRNAVDIGDIYEQAFVMECFGKGKSEKAKGKRPVSGTWQNICCKIRAVGYMIDDTQIWRRRAACSTPLARQRTVPQSGDSF